jgi:hypothetical protein
VLDPTILAHLRMWRFPGVTADFTRILKELQKRRLTGQIGFRADPLQAPGSDRRQSGEGDWYKNEQIVAPEFFRPILL